MTLHVGPLPAGDERHLKALKKAQRAARETFPFTKAGEACVAAYHRSLAEQGVRLVDASEVAEWLDDQCGSARAHWFLARFGGGDERPCEVCGAGPTGRCDPPDEYDGECPHGCSPER